MTNNDRVAEFKQRLDKVFRAYFITELCANAVEVVVGVIALMLALNSDNERALMLVILGMLVVLLATSSLTIRLFFGSFSGFSKASSFRTRYDFVLKNLEDNIAKLQKGKITPEDMQIAQTIFDDEINSLASEIDNITVKK